MIESSTPPPQRGLLADARRMAPVWAIVFVATVGSLYAIRANGRKYLERGIYEQENACEVAQVRRHAGERIWRDLLQDLDTEERRGASSENVFRGDARIPTAMEYFADAASLCPRMGGIHGFLADLAWWTGDVPRVHYHQGREHLNLNEFDDALVEFTAASLLDESDLRPAEQILNVHIRRDDLNRALDFLASAPEGLSETVSGLQVRARDLEGRRDLQGATELLMRALEQEPGDRLLILSLLRLHAAMGEPVEGARRAFDFLRQAQAPEADSYHSVAIVLMENGEWQEALIAISRALAIQPNSSVLMMERSAILFELGRDVEARAALQDAFSRDPAGFTRRLAEERFTRLRD